jgi:hypothetical protein
MNWYIADGGKHWIRCEVLSNLMGTATVRLYTGETCRGKSRKGLFGWLVDAI